MTTPELAICLDDLGMSVKAAMERARGLGFVVLDMSATEGPISPGELSRTGQRHLLKHLSDLGLRLGSLRGPVDAAGYADRASGERRLDTMRSIIGLAAGLGVGVASTRLGGPVESGDESGAARMGEALVVLADEADRAGVMLAVETAGIGASALAKLLAEINCPLVTSCCDSGAMLMQGDDPHGVGATLAGRVGLVRARDAVGPSAGAAGYEVAQGEGQLEIPAFLAALREAGFGGSIVLSRTCGSQPAADLGRARLEFEKHLR